jgi:4-cresol dehydrogenase (hydroxylating) flavoprotein subunit
MNSIFSSVGSHIDIISAEEAQRIYGTDTGAANRRLAGALVVKNSAAIAKILEIANDKKAALWPISGGRNFGYGTSLPVQQDSFIVDLTQLKGIKLDIDTCTAEIEPGVTQGDLYKAFKEAGVSWMVPTTGAGPNGSILGNALDGGYGINPICDHFDGITQVAGYWANGTPFHHPLAELGCTEVSRSWKHGIGPSWIGLLHQASFGIVIKATIQFVPLAEASRIIIFEFSSDEQFKTSISKIRNLSRNMPGLRSLICNSRLRITATQAPGRLHPFAALPPAERAEKLEETGKREGLPPWLALGFLYGSTHAVAGALKDVRKHLPGVKIRAFSPQQVVFLERLTQIIPIKKSFKGKLASLRDAVDLLQGRPNPKFLALAYALSSAENSTEMTEKSHPAKDNCGVLWYAPLIPANAEVITHFLQNDVTKILHNYGFDSLLAVSLRNANIFTSTIPILFDKQDAEAVNRAKECYRSLVEAGLQRGYPPYRLGTDYMDLLQTPFTSAKNSTPKQLRQTFDPNKILAPGRYVD